MPLGVTCPSCTHKFLVPDKMAGRNVKCPACEQAFAAPGTVVRTGNVSEVFLPDLPPEVPVRPGSSPDVHHPTILPGPGMPREEVPVPPASGNHREEPSLPLKPGVPDGMPPLPK